MHKRLLFVDDEFALRATMSVILRQHGFEVTTAETVAEALFKITTEKFDVLLSDLNLGNPADGLTIVSAMRRTQPEALTMILTGYPSLETALEAMRQQVDDYLVKPAHIPSLVKAIESKLAAPPPARQFPPAKRVGMLLQQSLPRVEELWFEEVERDRVLSRLPLTQGRRKALRQTLEEVVRSAQRYSAEEQTEPGAPTATYDGRDFEGYTPTLLLTEFRLLRRALEQVVQENLISVNMSHLIPDMGNVNNSLDLQAQAALTALLDRLNDDKAMAR